MNKPIYFINKKIIIRNKIIIWLILKVPKMFQAPSNGDDNYRNYN